MKILFAHSHSRSPGGEDEVVSSEAALLEAHGHEVLHYTARKDSVDELHPLTLAYRTIWSNSAYRNVRALLRQHHPAVLHVHNTLALISPAIYHAARAEGVPVVHTLHNFRLLCSNGSFFRDGHVCEDCLGKRIPWPGVQHACHRDSYAASAAVAMTLTVHRSMGTWTELVDAFIAPTEFSRRKHIDGGLPAERIIVNPNFMQSDPGVGRRDGGFALFVGRLSQEDGIEVLLDAWKLLHQRVPLRIVGDGLLAEQVAAAARAMPEVQWLGPRSKSNVTALMQSAAFLVAPAIRHDGGLSLTVLEAFSTGLPVLMSDFESPGIPLDSSQTGFQFPAGAPPVLARAVTLAMEKPELLTTMAKNARAEFEAHYSADRAYERLMQAYEMATDRAARRALDTGGSHRHGTFVVVVGPDGIGKTSVARSLIDQHRGPTAYVHFTPPFVGTLPARPSDSDAPAPVKHVGGGWPPLGWMRLARNFARFWIGYLARMRPALARDTLVVADRWAYGYLGQPRALRFYGPEWLARAALRCLPRPDLVVNLTAAPDVIRARKQELTVEEIERELAAWALLPEPRSRTFQAEVPPEMLARRIRDALRM